MQFSAKTIKGLSLGREIGFPTINLKIPTNLNLSGGVYNCSVKLNNHTYRGLLYFGPKTIVDKRLKTLEIHLTKIPHRNRKPVLKIRKNQNISVVIGQFIRPPKNFNKINALKNQLKKDIQLSTANLV